MAINKESVRRQDFNMIGGMIKEIYFPDTQPTFIQIRNFSSSDALYVSPFQNVSTSNFDISIVAGATRTYAVPKGLKYLYLFINSNTKVSITSGEGDVSPNDLDQTAQSIIVNNSLQSSVTISAGTSHIGQTSLDAPLPSGTNTIGNVNVSAGQSAVSSNPVLVSQAPKSSFQTLKYFTGTVTTSTSATTVTNLYTVTSGKTFYLTDVSFCNNSNQACQVSVNASATAGANNLIIGHALNTSPFQMSNIGSEPPVNAGSPLTAQVGATTTTTTISYFIAGYEQ